MSAKQCTPQTILFKGGRTHSQLAKALLPGMAQPRRQHPDVELALQWAHVLGVSAEVNTKEGTPLTTTAAAGVGPGWPAVGATWC
jgi:hypothetical protein